MRPTFFTELHLVNFIKFGFLFLFIHKQSFPNNIKADLVAVSINEFSGTERYIGVSSAYICSEHFLRYLKNWLVYRVNRSGSEIGVRQKMQIF